MTASIHDIDSPAFSWRAALAVHRAKRVGRTGDAAVERALVRLAAEEASHAD